MVVTSIAPCLKVTKESNMSEIDIYIELGDRVKIIDNKNDIFIGKLSFIELGKDEEEDDVIYILLENEKIISLGISYVEDIETL